VGGRGRWNIWYFCLLKKRGLKNLREVEFTMASTRSWVMLCLTRATLSLMERFERFGGNMLGFSHFTRWPASYRLVTDAVQKSSVGILRTIFADGEEEKKRN
jgi:hypothetical protein